MNILVYALSAPLGRGPYGDLPTWLSFANKCPYTGHVERAIWGGFHADRLGYAFAAGYGAAISRLFDHAGRAQRLPSTKSFPDPPPRGHVALCASEAAGAHPRAIATRLDKQGGALVLNGEKTFATLAPVAGELLVVASRGAGADGKNRLRVVRVAPKARGIRITARPETPFAPEIPHGIVRFEDVVIEDRDVLPGDGWDFWIKPFRTIEDVHVLASTVGYLLGAARAYGWDRGAVAELVSLALALVDVGAREPDDPLTHVLLAGLFESARRLVKDLDHEWVKAEADERARWERDAPLLLVAESARTKRTEVAWKTVSGSWKTRAAK